MLMVLYVGKLSRMGRSDEHLLLAAVRNAFSRYGLILIDW